MTEGPVYQWSYDNLKLALELGTYEAGDYLSAPIWPYTGWWEQFFLYVWVRSVSGTSPSWVSFLETTTDDVNSLSPEEITWTEAPVSRTPIITDVGSVTSNCQVPITDTYIRVHTVITGTMEGRTIVSATPPMENPPELASRQLRINRKS
jgi:hypothetical protein